MGEGYEEGDEIPEKDRVIIIVKVYFEVAKEVGGSEPAVVEVGVAGAGDVAMFL